MNLSRIVLATDLSASSASADAQAFALAAWADADLHVVREPVVPLAPVEAAAAVERRAAW